MTQPLFKIISYFIPVKKWRRAVRSFNLDSYKKDMETNKKISNYKIVHIMRNDKFNKPFVDFLNKNFDVNEHLVLCQRDHKETAANPFPVGENVYEFFNIKNIDLSSEKVEKIICHSLFMPDLIEKLYAEPELLKKAYWVIWGGDLYEALRDKKNDFVRKNFKGYIHDVDKYYAIKKYEMGGQFYKTFYNFPLSKVMLDGVEQTEKLYTRIQINNSCDSTIMDMLDILSKFKNEDIKIMTILSYGDLKFKDEIIQKGQNIFGEKFEYVTELMLPQDYAQHLASNDILILNQNRQQGVGNTFASLYLGKKVFIKKETSVNEYLNADGIKIFNTQDIEDMDFETFKNYPERQSVIDNVSKYLDEKYLVKLWNKVFFI